VLALVLAAALGQADAGAPRLTPPPQLACLTRWYAGTVRHDADGGWGLEVPDAGFVPWDSGGDPAPDAGEAADDSAEVADLEDVFHTAYVKGPIKPVVAVDDRPPEDPGRARIEPLFRATYGGSRAQIAARLTKVKFFGLRYPFHEKAAPALERVVKRLELQVKKDPKLLPFLKHIGGTWAFRRISHSPNLSMHAFGIAIDLNVKRSSYWRWQRPKKPLKWTNRMPQAIVDAFEAEGFIWGGRWAHYDTMHFEYRPELLECGAP